MLFRINKRHLVILIFQLIYLFNKKFDGYEFLFDTRKSTSVASQDSAPTTERYGGLPLKACSNLALQQLEDVLTKCTEFETFQADYNF